MKNNTRIRKICPLFQRAFAGLASDFFGLVLGSAFFSFLTLTGAHAAEFEAVDKLSVNGSALFKTSVTIISPDTVSSSLWTSTSTTTPQLYVSTGGNVGLGKAGPGARLEVAGQIKITGGAPAAGSLLTSDTDGLAVWQAPSGAGIPSGAVAFFNMASCPSGWTALTGARGRYLVGLPSGGTLAGASGTVLTDLESRPVGQHNHTITDPGHTHNYSGGGTLLRASSGINTAIPSAGSTGIANTGISVDNTGIAGTNAPYTQLLVCQKD